MQNQFDFFAVRDFRLILKREFDLRNQRRPAYSLNAFARDIGMSPQRFSGVLKGHFGISRTAARSIAKALQFTETQSEFLCDLVDSQHGRSEEQKKEAALRLLRYKVTYEERLLPEYTLDLFGRWFNIAIHELIKIHNGKITSEKIAKKLRLTEEECRSGLQCLSIHGLIQIRGNEFSFTDGFVTASSPIPSKTIRGFHQQFLEQVKSAIERVPMTQRKNRSTVVCFDKSRTEEARLWLEKMHQEFIKEFGSGPSATNVYGLGVYLFPLEEQ